MEKKETLRKNGRRNESMTRMKRIEKLEENEGWVEIEKRVVDEEEKKGR